jgi:hypothetical protein
VSTSEDRETVILVFSMVSSGVFPHFPMGGSLHDPAASGVGF